MFIKIYSKNNLKNKFLFSTAIFFLIAALSVSISFSSHKTEKSQENSSYIKLPIIMYHLILKNPRNTNKFIISEKTFEEDLKYINDNGYTTILIKDLIEYTQNQKELPPKPILLTFDDGAYNNYLYAFPLAKKYNAKFVFSPIAKESNRYSEINDENPEYAHANWNRISEMANSGLVEIQNHTYDMHSTKKPRLGCTKKSSESSEVYQDKITKDLKKAQKLIKEKTGSEPNAFFYPFGACSECTENIVKSLGFKATFLCESKVNLLTKNPQCLFGLQRFLRPPQISSKIFFSKFEK